MKSRSLSILLAFPLAACSYVTTPLPAPYNLTLPCDEIRQLPDDATLGDLLEADVELIGQYRECSARQKALADWVK